jgi:hypothetical protein
MSQADKTRADSSPFGKPQTLPMGSDPPDPTTPTITQSPSGLGEIPTMGRNFDKVTQRLFDTIGDPDPLYQALENDISLKCALTPGNLQQALNFAEDNARKAHAMYVVAVAEYEAFEAELDPIVEAMRAAATTALQDEKDQKKRSKNITDSDVRGRASVMYPDEWKRAIVRKSKATAMRDHLSRLASLWQNRCFSLSSMLNAGKRS